MRKGHLTNFVIIFKHFLKVVVLVVSYLRDSVFTFPQTHITQKVRDVYPGFKPPASRETGV